MIPAALLQIADKVQAVVACNEKLSSFFNSFQFCSVNSFDTYTISAHVLWPFQIVTYLPIAFFNIQHKLWKTTIQATL